MGRLAGAALCVCVVAVPLFSGGATPLGTMVVRLSAIGLFLIGLSGRNFALGLEPLFKPLAALVLLAILGLFQGTPLPRGPAQLLSPTHVALADAGALALGESPAARVALSLDPVASRRVALDCLVLVVLGIAAYWVGRRSARRAWLAIAVVGTAVVQVVLGLRPWLGGLVPRLQGAYANPDHFCILLEMASCVACAGVFWAFSTHRFEGETALRAIGVLLTGTTLLFLLSAIAFTGSRSGILAILVGLSVQIVVTGRNRRWRTLAAAGAVGMAAASFLAWVGITRSFGRLASTSWFEVVSGARSVVWRESLELIRDFPVVGTGLGTFEQAFPLVQPASLEGIRWAKAHNDFLEWMVTGGVVAVAILAVGGVFLLKTLISQLRSAVRTDDRAAISAALGCLVSVAVHEVFDFGLSLPANAFVLTAVVAASLARRES